MRTDWLPSSRTGMVQMASSWSKIVTEKAEGWNLPGQIPKILEDLCKDAKDALALATSSDRSPATNQQIRTTFGVLTDYMRDLKRRYFFMPPLSEVDWISLGLRLPDTTPTHIGPPSSVVSAEITYPHKNSLSLFIVPIDSHRYDERADWGFRVYFGVLPHSGDVSEEIMIERQYLRRAPQNPEELTQSHFTRRKRDLIEFPYDNSGKQCFICIRYENSKGDKGPWGPIVSSFIP